MSGPRSFAHKLPWIIREWLQAELLRRGFRDYDEITAELNRRCREAGVEISPTRSAVHRFGRQLQRSIARTGPRPDPAKAFKNVPGGQAGSHDDAAIRLIQDEIFYVVMKSRRLTELVAGMQQIGATREQFIETTRRRAKDAAAGLAELIREQGLSIETVERVRREILAICADESVDNEQTKEKRE